MTVNRANYHSPRREQAAAAFAMSRRPWTGGELDGYEALLLGQAPPADPPDAEPGQTQGEGQEDRRLVGLEGPEAAGGLVADLPSQVLVGQESIALLLGAGVAGRDVRQHERGRTG